MKNFLLLALMLSSVQAFANFNSVTLKTDVKLTRSEVTGTLIGLKGHSAGSDYCTISISSSSDAEEQVVPSGTVFSVTNVEANKCVRDWGKQCRLDLHAHNGAEKLDLTLICKDKGLLARVLTVKKVNFIAREIISVK